MFSFPFTLYPRVLYFHFWRKKTSLLFLPSKKNPSINNNAEMIPGHQMFVNYNKPHGFMLRKFFPPPSLDFQSKAGIVMLSSRL